MTVGTTPNELFDAEHSSAIEANEIQESDAHQAIYDAEAIKSKFKSVLMKDTVVYSSVTYFATLVSLFLTPIFTRTISRESYGILDIFTVWTTFASTVISLGLATAILKFYPEQKDDRSRKELVSSIVVIAVVSCSVFVGCAYIGQSYYFSRVFGEQSAKLSAVYPLAVSTTVLSVFFGLILSVLRAQFRKFTFASIAILNYIILASLGFILVYYLRLDVYGFFVASLIGALAAVGIGIVTIRQDFCLSPNGNTIRKILAYSLPLVFVGAIFHVTQLVDRWILSEYLTLGDVGAYSIAARISGVSRLVFGALGLAYFPYAISISEKPYAGEVYTAAHKVYVTSAAFILAALFAFRSEIIAGFAPHYDDATPSIIWISLSHVLMDSVYIYTVGIHLTGRTHFLTLAAIASVLANVVSSVGLVGRFGAEGVAFGSMVGAAVWIGMQILYSQRVHPIHFPVTVVAMALMVVMSASAISPYPVLLKTGYISVIAIGCVVYLRAVFGQMVPSPR